MKHRKMGSSQEAGRYCSPDQMYRSYLKNTAREKIQSQMGYASNHKKRKKFDEFKRKTKDRNSNQRKVSEFRRSGKQMRSSSGKGFAKKLSLIHI